MRKIILSTAAILSLVLSSCESKKTENTEVLTNKSEVVEQPVVSESDIANNLESSASTNSYMVLLDNGQEKKVALDPNETIISANNLPVNAQNFV
ncbi:hypothetical protein [Empedobacter tilapiae]